MKKLLSIVLAVVMTAVLFAGCGAAKTVKFGVGVYSYYEAGTNATEEAEGTGEVVSTAAAVMLDADGKIVKCVIDTVDYTAHWTLAGEDITYENDEDIKTKYELGTNYGMAAYGNDVNGDGKVLEWNEQIDAFCSVVEGKTIDEVKALVVDGYQGNEEVMNAGCTIGIADYVKALEKAVANVQDSGATANDTLKLAFVSTDEGKGATEEADGSVELEVTIVGAAVNADGKVSAMVTDAVQAAFGFNTVGAATYDAAAEIKTKLEKGDSYNMAAYGTDLNGDGKVLEWYDQAAAFNAECLGKTASEISALVVDGYGVESLQTAGCTIGISDMVKAAVKAATVA
ncbi:MAG: hypothetical protein IJ424_00860 [Oscillospiraceae bacterium]|nr:hypothetical protein [Oscillospiraceae bacterium]